MNVLESAVLLISLFTCCVAPKCYSCFSQTDEGCGDLFWMKTSQAKYCDGTCIKYRGERYCKLGLDRRVECSPNQVRIVEVTRTCTSQQNDGEYTTKYNGISVRAYACNSDYCNQSVSLHSALTTYFVTLVMLSFQML